MAELPPSLAWRGAGRINPRLEETAAALEALGRPQDAFRSILIAGTNGKGSTAAMLERLLLAHGVGAGLYTSPHLVRATERIRIGGDEVSAAALERTLARLDAFPELSFFETLTVAAFLLFAEAGVEVAVLEVGMGGRWDATRLAGPEVAGLTNVGTDHQRWLGSSRAAIATEKGAALQAAPAAVLGPSVEPALTPHLGAPHAVPAHSLVPLAAVQPLVGLQLGDGSILAVPLPGEHQRANLHLALALYAAAAARGLAPPLDPRATAAGLTAVSWPGRLSRCRVAGRVLLIDGAHNREGAEALARHLATLGDRHHLLFSCLDDKPVEAMAAALRPVVGEVAVYALADERAMPLERLAAAFPGATVAPDVRAGLARLPDPVVAAGSLRVVGELLALAEEG